MLRIAGTEVVMCSVIRWEPRGREGRARAVWV